MATKNAHWQAAFRSRRREAGLKAVTVWMPKEGTDRLARYTEKERGEVVTRALVLLESQGSPQRQLMKAWKSFCRALLLVETRVVR
jgi:hypothetical protein